MKKTAACLSIVFAAGLSGCASFNGANEAICTPLTPEQQTAAAAQNQQLREQFAEKMPKFERKMSGMELLNSLKKHNKKAAQILAKNCDDPESEKISNLAAGFQSQLEAEEIREKAGCGILDDDNQRNMERFIEEAERLQQICGPLRR